MRVNSLIALGLAAASLGACESATIVQASQGVTVETIRDDHGPLGSPNTTIELVRDGKGQLIAAFGQATGGAMPVIAEGALAGAGLGFGLANFAVAPVISPVIKATVTP